MTRILVDGLGLQRIVENPHLELWQISSQCSGEEDGLKGGCM